MPSKSKKPPPTQKDFRHTWYLQEWMRLYNKKQADLIKELNWSRAVASAVFNGQQYTQTLIDQLAPFLNVQPYELLMTPERAHMLRQLEHAVREVQSNPPAETALPSQRAVGDLLG